MKLLALLACFTQVGLFSIGGGYATIPLIQEQVVKMRHWLEPGEFTDIITISQMTPGPLAVNTSTFVGIRVAGLSGAIIATFGCVISGFLISLFLDRFFQKYRQAAYAANVLSGLRAISAGLIASAAATIIQLVFNSMLLRVNLTAAILFALSFLLLRKVKMNPILVMALAGVAGYFLYS